MYKLLRSTCLHCFQLKMRQTEVDKFTEKLQLLAKGKLIEAAAVITGGGKAAETAKSFVEAGDEENDADVDADVPFLMMPTLMLIMCDDDEKMMVTWC